MDILYQKNNLLLRRAQAKDPARLATVLRWEDRAELAASHPGKEPKELLESFWRSSACCFVLEYEREPVAMFGLAPDVWLGNRACVWLLTGRKLARVSKSFVRLAGGWLSAALAEYAELYNFVDERYTAALRLIARLGGRFDGRFYATPYAKFLHFTFRRKEYGRNL